MIRYPLFLLLVMGTMFQASLAFAQANLPGPPFEQRFEEMAPQIGDLVPDVTIFDDQGSPVNMRELARDRYTVLIVGCLS